MTCSHPRKKLWIVAAAAAALTSIIYRESLKNGFVNWDDNVYMPLVQQAGRFSVDFLGWAFTTFSASNYHPMTWLSYGLDYSIWGPDPWGFHLTNVILHGVNTLLVILCAARLISASGPEQKQQGGGRILIAAGITGILFGLHPLHVESVAWISERKDVLYALFYLVSVYAYLGYVSRENARKKTSYLLSLSAFMLSLLSKPMAVTLPLVLFLFDVYPLQRLAPRRGADAWRAVVLEKLPFLSLSAIASFITLKAQSSSEALAAIGEMSFTDRLITAVRALFFYLEKFSLPRGLAPFYPISRTITPVDVVQILLFIAVLLFCILGWRRIRTFSTAWLFYVATLIPVLGIIQVGSQAAADRYTYIALLGPMLLIGLGCAAAFEKLRTRSLLRNFSICLFAVLISGMSLITFEHIGIWRDSESLWKRQTEVFFFDPFGYKKLGEYYYRRGAIDKALHYYTLVLQISPDDYRTLFDRGVALFVSGRHDEALADFRRVLKIEHSYRNSPSFLRLAGQISFYIQSIEQAKKRTH